MQEIFVGTSIMTKFLHKTIVVAFSGKWQTMHFKCKISQLSLEYSENSMQEATEFYSGCYTRQCVVENLDMDLPS